ncbi:MAG TPA: EAL domain-containing protein [Gammaproteobacteria bacterium]
MKPRATADQTRLKLLLAVKGRADNLDLLQPVKLFSDARVELNNPRSIKDLQTALDAPDYDLIICDYQLLNTRTIALLEKSRGNSGGSVPLVIFMHEADPDKFKQARALQCLHAFVMKELEPVGLHNLVHMALKHALLRRCQLTPAPALPPPNDFNRSYAYHATIDTEGYLHTDWISGPFETVTGYSVEEVKRAGGWVSLVDKEDLPKVRTFVGSLITNKAASVIYRLTSKSGSPIWLEGTGQPEWSESEQRVTGISGGARDVTDREQLKLTLQTLNRQQMAIVGMGELTTRETDLSALLRQTVLLVTQTLEAWICEIFTLDKDNNQAILQAGTGLESEIIGKLALPVDKDNELAFVLHNETRLLIGNLRHEDRFKPSSHLRKQKAASGICLPIKADQEVFGFVAVYSNEVSAFNENHLNFVQSIATLLAAFFSKQSTEFRLRTTRDALVEQTRQLRGNPEDNFYLQEPSSQDDDISVIVKTAKELRGRDLILSATSKITRILIDTTDWRIAMNEVLAELGQAANISRAYLCSNHTDLTGDLLTSMLYEWVNSGVQSCMKQSTYQNMSLEHTGLARFAEILDRGGIIVGKVEEFTESEQAFFKRIDVKSTAIVPIFLENKWWGFLGFDACNVNRSWSTAEVDALRIAANMISSVLERKHNDAALHAVMEGTVSKTGEDYFRSLVKHLAEVFNADYCLIAEATGKNHFKVRTALHNSKYLASFEYRQEENIFRNNSPDDIVHYPTNVHQAFPDNTWLTKRKIEGYLAIPMLDNQKNILGHIAVMSTNRLDADILELQILKIFAARAGVELERQRMERENLQLARISLENPNMLIIADLQGNIVLSNPACTRMMDDLGLPELTALLPENHNDLIEEALNNKTQAVTAEKNIADYSFQWNYYLQSDLDRIHIYAVDLTQYRLAENQLRKDAFHDVLTGLPNRIFFNNLLTHAIERTMRRDDYTFAVLFLDLDRFKYINDSLGHAYGDKFLEIVSQLLKNCLRPGDHIARFGGDEFAILLDSVTGEEDATNIATRIQQVLSRPIKLDQHETFTSASIGVALSNRGYTSPQDILRDADIAMYSAKQAGKARHAVFDSHMHDEMIHVLKLETDLRNALKNGELSVYYQPIYSIPQKSLTGFEALVRWHHPGKGFLEPHDFIPLAEEMSIIRDIDYLVLREAARQLKVWRKKYELAKNIKMNVNLSGIHFNSTAILAEIGHVLKDNNLSNDSLQIELTEGVIMDNTGRSTEIFHVLSQLGVHISIDDFGVGYSSLSRLTKLPVDMLKIDRGFVQSMIVDSSSLNITRAIIDLAHDLDMEVIAEGVETQGQFQILSRMGCHYAQGYYISKPLSTEDVERFLVSPPSL